MAAGERLICASRQVQDGGTGYRFCLDEDDPPGQAFVIRYRGQVHGYLNRCAHVPVELDWAPGEFFDHSKLYLICSVHGALYDPTTGACLLGRCNGRGLEPVPVFERDGNIYLREG